MYLQCEPDEDIDEWSDEAIWDELDRRFGMSVNRGAMFEKGMTPMRRFVVEPMQHEICSSPATPRTSSRRPAPRA